jgi:hypothetical protein
VQDGRCWNGEAKIAESTARLSRGDAVRAQSLKHQQEMSTGVFHLLEADAPQPAGAQGKLDPAS